MNISSNLTVQLLAWEVADVSDESGTVWQFGVADGTGRRRLQTTRGGALRVALRLYLVGRPQVERVDVSAAEAAVSAASGIPAPHNVWKTAGSLWRAVPLPSVLPLALTGGAAGVLPWLALLPLLCAIPALLWLWCRRRRRLMKKLQRDEEQLQHLVTARNEVRRAIHTGPSHREGVGLHNTLELLKPAFELMEESLREPSQKQGRMLGDALVEASVTLYEQSGAIPAKKLERSMQDILPPLELPAADEKLPPAPEESPPEPEPTPREHYEAFKDEHFQEELDTRLDDLQLVRLDMEKRQIVLLHPINFYGSKYKDGVDIFKEPEIAEQICHEAVRCLVVCNEILAERGLEPCQLDVQGHTSASIHGADESLSISTKRATRCSDRMRQEMREVCPELSEEHLEDQIWPNGFGNTRPLPGFDDGGGHRLSGYEENRRVELHLVSPGEPGYRRRVPPPPPPAPAAAPGRTCSCPSLPDVVIRVARKEYERRCASEAISDVAAIHLLRRSFDELSAKQISAGKKIACLSNSALPSSVSASPPSPLPTPRARAIAPHDTTQLSHCFAALS